VAALPPEVGEPEGDLDEPEERQAEHPQEHPRPDAAGRRLAHEALAEARVEREDDDDHDERDEEADPQEQVVAPHLVELSRGKDLRGRDTRPVEPVGNLRLPERPGGQAPAGRERGREQAGER
jgi:hypothetical protein